MGACHNVATQEIAYSDGFTPSEGYHEQSHGESFLALAQSQLQKDSVYIFDEPEAALSPQRQLTLLKEIYDCANNGSQFIIVTHSPILLGIPNSEILTFDNGKIHACDYEDTDTYQITEMFINHDLQIFPSRKKGRTIKANNQFQLHHPLVISLTIVQGTDF